MCAVATMAKRYKLSLTCTFVYTLVLFIINIEHCNGYSDGNHLYLCFTQKEKWVWFFHGNLMFIWWLIDNHSFLWCWSCAVVLFTSYVQFANDECDYGQGLELGNDLFCFGDESLHGYIRSLLPMAYNLLGYGPFEKIILAHLKQRTKGTNSYLTWSSLFFVL